MSNQEDVPAATMRLKISVVTVVHNSADTIAKTMDSVLSQDYSDWEHIIVDGASTDATPEIIRSYESRYGGRLRWVSEPDTGIYDAMNKGIAMSTGQVVGTLNADDHFASSEVLGRIAEVFECRPVEAVYGDVEFFSPDNPEDTVRRYSGRRFAPWQMRFGMMPPHPTFYCRRDLFDHLGPYRTDMKIASDFDLLLRFLLIGKVQSRYIPLVFTRMRTGGRSNSGLGSRMLLNSETVRACRENGVFTCLPMVWLKYPFKIFQYILPRK